MKAADLSRYIKDPGAMGPGAVSELSQLVNDFPYFQPAHILLSMAARRWDAAVYQQTLKKTAIVVTNRTRLFELISQLEEQGGASLPQEAAAAADEIPLQNNELLLLKVVEHETAKPTPSAEKETVPETVKDEASVEQLETEIGRQVVNSFVEQEMRKAAEPKPTAPAELPESFGDWLAFLKKNHGQPYHEIAEEVRKDKARQAAETEPAPQPVADRKLKNKAIIDKIIERNPGHIRVKDEARFFSPETRARESLLENEHLVTETLARIYALQGNTAKAIRAYEILSLKNPQKSAYFAGLIQKLRNNDKTE